MNHIRRKSGQIVLVLVFVLLAMVFLFIMHLDVFLAIRNKTRLQNAGDAAALAAARWQGLSLNMIGELNLVRLAAACSRENYAAVLNPATGIAELRNPTVEDVLALQERIAIAGPLIAFMAANDTARVNLENAPGSGGRAAAEMDDLRALVGEAAATARELDYSSPSWPTKGQDYAAMLRAAAGERIWAGADNARLLPPFVAGESHPLYDIGFYAAAESKDWPRICLRLFGGDHAKATATLLSWPGWGDVPPLEQSPDIQNSEFYGLGITRQTCLFTPEAKSELAEIAAGYGLATFVNAETINAALALDTLPWYCYDISEWRAWSELDPAAGFPLLAPVKPEFNVRGAMAASRVVGELVPLSETSITNLFEWVATAKAFGSHRGSPVTEAMPETPIILPSFKFARLIPYGGEPNHNAADPAWIRHCSEHVPGNFRNPACRYCRILELWDSPGYTAEGGNYLAAHGHDEVCAPPSPPGGGGPGGGTPYAH